MAYSPQVLRSAYGELRLALGGTLSSPDFTTALLSALTDRQLTELVQDATALSATAQLVQSRRRHGGTTDTTP